MHESSAGLSSIALRENHPAASRQSHLNVLIKAWPRELGLVDSGTHLHMYHICLFVCLFVCLLLKGDVCSGSTSVPPKTTYFSLPTRSLHLPAKLLTQAFVGREWYVCGTP